MMRIGLIKGYKVIYVCCYSTEGPCGFGDALNFGRLESRVSPMRSNKEAMTLVGYV